MIVLSSNQALIWETLEKINENKSVTGLEVYLIKFIYEFHGQRI